MSYAVEQFLTPTQTKLAIEEYKRLFNVQDLPLETSPENSDAATSQTPT